MTCVPIDQAPAGPALEMDINQEEGVASELMHHHVTHFKKYGFLHSPNLLSAIEWFRILKPEYPELMVAIGTGFYKDTALYLPTYRDELLAHARLMINRQERQLVRAGQCLEMVEQQRLPHGWPGTEPAK